VQFRGIFGMGHHSPRRERGWSTGMGHLEPSMCGQGWRRCAGAHRWGSPAGCDTGEASTTGDLGGGAASLHDSGGQLPCCDGPVASISQRSPPTTAGGTGAGGNGKGGVRGGDGDARAKQQGRAAPRRRQIVDAALPPRRRHAGSRAAAGKKASGNSGHRQGKRRG
jgi:hypothetical protein